MKTTATYARNQELFRDFYSLQDGMTRALAGHPALIRTWLNAQPPRSGESGESSGASKSWRAARLSIARRRELAGLIAAAEGPGDAAPLGAWLLASVPARTYLEIADLAAPGFGQSDPAAETQRRRLLRMRETLFAANYGLAKAAAYHSSHPDYDDRLSAASCGLLDAIDRYVPNARAARFGYFASYWIRYHLSRHAQKCGSLVAFPINQHRLCRRIDRYLTDRQAGGRPRPSVRELCAELHLGRDALYWHQLRPRMVSLCSPAGGGPDSPTVEHLLCDPAPDPVSILDEREIGECQRALLRRCASPATRVMLAYTRGIGGLAEAAEDYLAEMGETARQRLS